MDDPNVIVLMNVSGNTTPKQRPSDTTKTRQFLTDTDAAGDEIPDDADNCGCLPDSIADHGSGLG